ncbi:16S rRNA (uracil(1498)-N(3))-methyltransferase [Luteibacter sp. UNCMF366Tsu5.1]|uniref:16S rRNA (uracil(1498)-N(3))-methyltransferase n=1 Tax=Luteibacter sp. UNCMF366Tsu5.1 TaxID=1502758 RepID=UPI0009088469|nr:16S rRNA (uracil(1498)-N(3))-methyltransferase [Luteibacter sp. UNCMF366Tsu5.1]SFW58073.1 16S rRNA (uracil1498-N3)-methyltransferase [Luteibacter sp. UNCMF366Tsu5.1]
MRTIRIHVDAPLATGQDVALPAQAGEHVARVLRLEVGAPVVLFGGHDGMEYDAVLAEVGKRHVVAKVGEGRAVGNESPLSLTLAQGVARGDKMDFIVQKATELGIARIVPLLTERSEVKLDAARAEKRLAHWRAVAASACEQSGRARVPVIEPAVPLAAWLTSLGEGGPMRLALLQEGARRPAELALRDTAILAIGPEGGFGERDRSALAGAGFTGLKLGPRILRTETAGLAAIAALQALYGDV